MNNVFVYFDHLPRIIREPIVYMAQRLVPMFGDNLLSMAVVGNALSEDFNPKTDRIRTFLVVKTGGYPVMKMLSVEQGGFTKNKLEAPQVLIQENVKEFAAAMGIEFLDYQYNHSIVCGFDPFGEIHFDKEDILRQCRNRIKHIKTDLQYYFIRSGGRGKGLEQGLTESLQCLPEFLRAILWLLDVKRDREIVPVINKVALEFGLDVRALSFLMELKIENKRPDGDQIATVYEHIYTMMETLSQKLYELDLQKVAELNQHFSR